MSIKTFIYTIKSEQNEDIPRFQLKRSYAFHRGSTEAFLNTVKDQFDTFSLFQSMPGIGILPKQKQIICNKKEVQQLNKLQITRATQQDSINRYQKLSHYINSQRICRDYDLALRDRKQRILSALSQTVGIACINKETNGGML